VAEKGVVGLIAFIYLWYVYFRESWSAWKMAADDLSRALVAGGIAALIGFHVAGLFEGNFGHSELAMIMWLMVGLVMWAKVGRGGEIPMGMDHDSA
jgi:O-antigen ligase